MLLSQHQMTMKTLRVYPFSFSLFHFSILRRRLKSCGSLQDRFESLSNRQQDDHCFTQRG